MRRIRMILLFLFACLVVGGYFALRATAARVKAVPSGHKEIAYLQAATNGSSWERFVAGLRRLKGEIPELIVDESNAFPEQSAEVPEVSLGFQGNQAKLWIRWYKITSEVGIADWVHDLADRTPAPLAFTGLGSSDRARDLALELAKPHNWHGDPPLLLLDTATADNINPHDMSGPLASWQPLMHLYSGRTFRFCFSNRQMAEAMCDFVWSHPYVWAIDSTLPSVAAVPMAAANLLGSRIALALGNDLQHPDVRILQWRDDPYSTDLSQQFRTVLDLRRQIPFAGLLLDLPRFEKKSVDSYTILYSVGGYYRPNPKEAEGIALLVNQMIETPDQRHLLVLPTAERPARRMLRGIAARAPIDARDVVALAGDGISFNVIYRDRDFAWSIQDMPVPLILFCHQNPVAWPDQPSKPVNGTARSASSTDEELLNADIVRMLLKAVFVGSPPSIVASADELASRLREARQPDGKRPFFKPDGDRVGGSGEYVVCLRPDFEGGHIQPRATIEVWRLQTDPRWQLVRKLDVDYADAPQDGGRDHGGF